MTFAMGGDGGAFLESTTQGWVSQILESDFDSDGDGTGKLPPRLVFPGRWWMWPVPVPRPNELLIDPVAVLVSAGIAFSELGASMSDEAAAAAADRAANTLIRGAADTLARRPTLIPHRDGAPHYGGV
ncbi:hypothetical protein [Nocardia amamiensis]|uniref:hypothetical protein n=1 Tax=Nocardia amamiensis TaxID=404578 RepID=UPI001893B0CD|nr:hypothetical protein [Nocardia amamiensis]